MIEQEEQYVNPNVTVSYNVGPGHPLYDADAVEDFSWEELRAKRNGRLKMADKYQGVLFHATLTTTQQTELATYRQALLDITEHDTTTEAWDNWPSRPSWMLS